MSDSPFPRPAAGPPPTACPICRSMDTVPLPELARQRSESRVEGGADLVRYPEGLSQPASVAASAAGSSATRRVTFWLVAANVVLWGGALVLGLVIADTIPGWGFAPLALGFFLGLLGFGVLSAGRFARPGSGAASGVSPALHLWQRAAYCPTDDCIFVVGESRVYTRDEWRAFLQHAESTGAWRPAPLSARFTEEED